MLTSVQGADVSTDILRPVFFILPHDLGALDSIIIVLVLERVR